MNMTTHPTRKLALRTVTASLALLLGGLVPVAAQQTRVPVIPALAPAVPAGQAVPIAAPQPVAGIAPYGAA